MGAWVSAESVVEGWAVGQLWAARVNRSVGCKRAVYRQFTAPVIAGACPEPLLVPRLDVRVLPGPLGTFGQPAGMRCLDCHDCTEADGAPSATSRWLKLR